MRCLGMIATLLALACTASWNRVVRYSAHPAPPGNIAAGVYDAVFTYYFNPARDTIVVLDTPDWDLYALLGASRHAVPGYWADTLQREVRTALGDPDFQLPADSTDLAVVARRLGLRPLPPDRAGDERRKSATGPRIEISQPGFNGDSTIAVIRVVVTYGFGAGAAEVLYLARRPHRAWCVWYSALAWVA